MLVVTLNAIFGPPKGFELTRFSDCPNGLKESDGVKTSMFRFPGAGLTHHGIDRENF